MLSVIDKKPKWLQDITSSRRIECLNILNHERAQLLDVLACENCAQLGAQCVVVAGIDSCARCKGSGPNNQCNLDVSGVIANISRQQVIMFSLVVRLLTSYYLELGKLKIPLRFCHSPLGASQSLL